MTFAVVKRLKVGAIQSTILGFLHLIVAACWNTKTWSMMVTAVSIQFNEQHLVPYDGACEEQKANALSGDSYRLYHRNLSRSTSISSSWGVPNSRSRGQQAQTTASLSWNDGNEHNVSNHIPQLIWGKSTRIVVRHDVNDVQETYRFELGPGLASGFLLKSLGAGDYLLEKVAPKWFDRFASRFISGRSRSAILAIVEVIRSFEDHGVVDIFGKYSQPQIFLSIIAYSGLQKAFELEGLADFYQKNATEIPRDLLKEGDKEYFTLLDNLAHYASYASAAYGWKLGFAMKGTSFLGKITRGRIPGKVLRPSPRSESATNPTFSVPTNTTTTGPPRWKNVPMNDSSFFLRKTGREESDIVVAEWRSDTHRPGYVIVRDPPRKTLVFAIRGTWSFQDVLTDLCCAPQTFTVLRDPNETNNPEVQDLPSSFSQRLWNWFYSASKHSTDAKGPPNLSRAQRDGITPAHHGMLESAQSLLKVTQELVKDELSKHPDYSLVIVGHSMGGGVAALLGTLWSDVFPLSVFVYGPPCIAPLDATALIGSNTRTSIFSVAIEGDPFGFISLGHIAELTNAVDRLCADKKLREQVLHSTLYRWNRREKKIYNRWWLLHTMRHLHSNCIGEKMYPPGRLFLLKPQSSSSSSASENLRKGGREWMFREVPPQHFSHFQARPSKLDLSKHMPSLYEEALCELTDSVNG